MLHRLKEKLFKMQTSVFVSLGMKMTSNSSPQIIMYVGKLGFFVLCF